MLLYSFACVQTPVGSCLTQCLRIASTLASLTLRPIIGIMSICQTLGLWSKNTVCLFFLSNLNFWPQPLHYWACRYRTPQNQNWPPIYTFVQDSQTQMQVYQTSMQKPAYFDGGSLLWCLSGQLDQECCKEKKKNILLPEQKKARSHTGKSTSEARKSFLHFSVFQTQDQACEWVPPPTTL